MSEFPTQKQEDFARAIEDTTGVPLPSMRTKQAYSQYISENMEEYRLRIMRRIEKLWERACIRHDCKYYIHQDYPKCSYCTCPDNCILVDKYKEESEGQTWQQ